MVGHRAEHHPEAKGGLSLRSLNIPIYLVGTGAYSQTQSFMFPNSRYPQTAWCISNAMNLREHEQA